MSKPVKEFEILILGGGIAGMTAAIYAARANRRTAIVEQEICGGLVNYTHVIENFPSFKSIPGMELMERVLDQVESLGVEVDQVAEIIGISLTDPTKSIETEDYLYRAPVLIIATGRKPVGLPLETDCQEVHYCAICEGSAYKDKRVMVLGGGNSGFDESLYLLSSGVSHLTIVDILPEFPAARETREALLSRPNVSAFPGSRLKDLKIGDRLEGAVLEEIETGRSWTEEADGVFVYLGQRPATEPFKGVLDLDENGYILANPDLETNLPGVFAAGDVIPKRYRQITTAMADGTIAALNADRFLNTMS